MMDDSELLQVINSMEADSLGKKDNFIQENQDAFLRFMGEPYGDEEPNRSSVVTNDCADVVEADMPSLARTFLSSKEVVEFSPKSERPEDIQESKEKNIYIPHILKNVKDSFKKQHDFLKAIEIYKAGVLEYGIKKDKEVVKQKKYKGLTSEELTAIRS